MPGSEALLRSQAASRLVAGGTSALNNPLSHVELPGARRPAASGTDSHYLILPWRLGAPELAFMSPEDFFQDFLLPRAASGDRQLIVDVGANTGQFATTIGRSGHDGISFEPAPSTCVELRRNLERQRASGDISAASHLTVHCAAVGASRGSVRFRTSTANASRYGPRRTSASFGRAVSSAAVTVASNSRGGEASPQLVQRPLQQALQQPDVQQLIVPQLALDDVLPSDRRFLLLKSDTQGFEAAVLKGASRLLRRRATRFLLIEVSHLLLHGAGSSPSELLTTISSAGYDCTTLAFWGAYVSMSTGAVQYKPMPLPSALRCRPSGVISFAELAALLARVSPTNRSGWTDVLCWPAA